MNLLHKKIGKLVALGELTQAQANAVCACVEVEWDGCPDDFAAELEPLMEEAAENTAPQETPVLLSDAERSLLGSLADCELEHMSDQEDSAEITEKTAVLKSIAKKLPAA